MSTVRKKYDEAFKKNAVKLILPQSLIASLRRLLYFGAVSQQVLRSVAAPSLVLFAQTKIFLHFGCDKVFISMSICADQVEEAFEESGGTCGADRIAGKLRKRGFTASFGKVKRIMNSRGLFSVRLCCRRSLRDSRGTRNEDCENLPHNLSVTLPFQALPSNITYVPTGEGPS